MSRTRTTKVSTTIDLEYVSVGEDGENVFRNFPVDPEHSDQLSISIRPFSPDGTEKAYNATMHGRPQVVVSGSPAALEGLGRYLLALARLESSHPRAGTNVDDVKNIDGGTVHLVIRRESA